MANFTKLSPLFSAIRSFLKEVPIPSKGAPYIHDGIDVKRIMMLVIFALIPCTLMAVVNSGVQALVYGSGRQEVFHAYFAASTSLTGYFSFLKAHLLSILWLGCESFLPVLFVCYAVGGFWEVIFAVIRGHEISEGLLVTGILFALILPSTIPLWMVALGASFGIVIGKELFGGTGMNILNPALLCRCFLYFAFPSQMTGNVFIGTNSTHIKENLLNANKALANPAIDGFTQATCRNIMSIPEEIKRIHIDAIGAYFHKSVATLPSLNHQFSHFSKANGLAENISDLSLDQLQHFLSSPLSQGGLALSQDSFASALQFAKLKFGLGMMSDANLFFGNMIGSFGETSKFACLLGALFLIVTGIASWRIMLAVVLGTIGTASLFKMGALFLGPYEGAFNMAKFDFPIYKQFLVGGLVFGLVFMATDPVSSPYMKLAKWWYGLLIGALNVVIRMANPAFPEGIMLAILFGNVFSPLFDRIATERFRKKREKTIFSLRAKKSHLNKA